MKSPTLRHLLILSLAILLLSPARARDPRSSDWFYNPFNRESAHHRPIGTGAIYSSPGDPATAEFLQGHAFNINPGYKPWGCGIWESKPDDPVFTVTYEGLDADGTAEEFPVTCRLPLDMVMIQKRNKTGNFDGVLVVYDRAAGIIHQFRQFNWHTDTPTPAARPTAGSHKTWSLQGPGHGERLAEPIGTSASGVAAMFGILRGWEIKADGHPIGHALQMALPRLPRQFAIMLGREVWWPAVSMDGSAYVVANHNTGHVPYGSLWALPPVGKGGPDLSKLGLSEKGLRLAECMRDYGIYVVDGADATALRADQDFDDDLLAELRAQSAKFYRYLRMVVNSVPEDAKISYRVGDARDRPTGSPGHHFAPGEFPAGGGAPLAPNTAIDAAHAPAPSSQP